MHTYTGTQMRQGQRKVLDPPEGRDTGICELPDVSAGKQTQIQWRNSEHSTPESSLQPWSRPFQGKA